MVSPRDLQCALVAVVGSRSRHMAEVRRVLDDYDGENSVLDEVMATVDLSRKDLEVYREQITRWKARGIAVASYVDDDYPRQLRDVYDFPLVVFMRGHYDPSDRGVAIVGSRNASPTALKCAEEITTLLGDEGVTIVSGLARGIDGVAHRRALERGYRTVGVIGTGIDRYYPPEHHDLQDLVAREGLLISQFLPNTPPSRISFPMRNAVMSAYARSTIIVTAREKSGTRHQAKQAIYHGRSVVLMDSVRKECSWARKLVKQYGGSRVFVAHTSEEAASLAFESERQIKNFLRALTTPREEQLALL